MSTLQAKVGTFAKKNDGTGSQAVTGVGFTPKALILWVSGGTATDSWIANPRYAVGFVSAAAAKRMGVGLGPDTGVTDGSVCYADKALRIVAPGESTLAECDLTSFDADGFTLNWTTNNASAYLIHYLALAEAGLQVKVGEIPTKTATGNQAITGVGFQPDLVLQCSYGRNGAPPSNNTTSTTSMFQIGAVDAAGSQFVSGAMGSDGRLSGVGASHQVTDRVTALLTTTTPAVRDRREWVSMNADGFTLNCSQSDGTSHRCMYLALKGSGLSFKVGAFNKDTDGTGPQAITGVGFKPSAVLLATTSRAATGTPSVDAFFSLGAASAAGVEACASWEEQDGAGSQNADGVSSSGKIIKTISINQAVNAEADLSSLDSDGFTLDWTTNDAEASQIVYVAFGPGGQPPSIVGPTIDYGDFTRTGANNTPWGITFTATDLESTGADALTWQVRTASGGGGTLVASGTCTSGVEESADIAYNASGLVNGNQTLYLRVIDPDGGATDQSFTLKRDDDPPPAVDSGTIEVLPV